ncbi:hypothetical protein HNY73_008242 [Argiope bruennichi]|uniref:Uncharacterized protein n=1 Tax=Argiope bruennichi TaxID=94029 RepID=A0A8T0F5R6_ARGBR|nr:hypothetical protein HNY73_008242 [Argiope bruennichi]
MYINLRSAREIELRTSKHYKYNTSRSILSTNATTHGHSARFREIPKYGGSFLIINNCEIRGVKSPCYNGDFVLHLHLNDEEVEEFKASPKQCWQSEDPVQCKKRFDEEFKRKVSVRMKSRITISELTLEMYKATISSLMHVINCFSKHASLPGVQCKKDFKQNCSWLRIPELLDKGDVPHAYQHVLNDNTTAYRDVPHESEDITFDS